MSEFKPEEGQFNVDGVRIAIVVARWNNKITENLLIGARIALARHGVDEVNIDILRVPGAFELPLACQRAARSANYDAILALGCVIRGDTPHFDYVCNETSRGISNVSLNESLPVAFGLLTTDDMAQSEQRSGINFDSNHNENKGEEAALTALEMISLFRQL